MANKERGELSLKVGDKVYTLRPTLNAMCEAEERWGGEITTPELMQKCVMGNMRAVRVIVWAYLQEHHAKEFQDPKDVGRKIVNVIGLDSLNDQLNNLMGVNQPPETQEVVAPKDGANPQEAQDGTGDVSSPRLVVSA